VAIPIRLPAASSDIESGSILEWRKSVGDPVEAGDVLFDVETDKAVFEVESPGAGTLGKILFPGGSSDIPVDTVVGVLLEPGESVEDLADYQMTDGENEAELDGAPAVTAAGGGREMDGPVSRADEDGRILASPLARRVAGDLHVDLNGLAGRGPNGRILKADVEEAAADRKRRQSPQAPTVGTGEAATWTDLPNSNMRRVIARRLSEAKREIPHFYLTVDCHLDALLDLRTQLNAQGAADDTQRKVSVNDLIIKAAALALADVPAANSSWMEESVRRYDTVDIAVAVATPNGLITPVVRRADRKPLVQISDEIKNLGRRAREGSLQPGDYKGGGFTVTNLGMYGIREFSAIINPPQSCILAVGAGERRAVVRGENLEIATVASFTLSVDHRSVDGVIGAEFLQAFKRYIEQPLVLILRQG